MPQVVTELDLEIAKLKLKAEQVKAEFRSMQQAASQASLGDKLFGSKWNQTSKDVKDAFDPLSRGALVKAGGLGVGIYAAQQAMNALVSTVKELSAAEYLSAEQRGQMQAMASFFSELSENVDRFKADVIGSLGDFFTGGAVSRYAEMEMAAAGRERTMTLQSDLTAAREDRRQAGLSDEQKLAEMQRRKAVLEARRGRQTGDEALGTSVEIEKLGKEMDALERKLGEKSAALAEKIRAATQEFMEAQRETDMAGLNDAMRLVEMARQRAALEEKIKAARGDAIKQLSLGTDREHLEKQIVDMQQRLAEQGRNQFEKQQRDKEQIAGREKSIREQIAAKENEITGMKTPDTVYRAPGALAGQFNWLFGRGNDLVADSTDRLERRMGELQTEVAELRKKLSDLQVVPSFGP